MQESIRDGDEVRLYPSHDVVFAGTRQPGQHMLIQKPGSTVVEVRYVQSRRPTLAAWRPGKFKAIPQGCAVGDVSLMSPFVRQHDLPPRRCRIRRYGG